LAQDRFALSCFGFRGVGVVPVPAFVVVVVVHALSRDGT
jgi:hypothetical protein